MRKSFLTLSGANKLHRNAAQKQGAFATDISELGHCKDLPMKIEIEPEFGSVTPIPINIRRMCGEKARPQDTTMLNV